VATEQPKPSDATLRKRVRAKTIEGLNAARMRPARPTYFMLCIGNKGSLAYMGPKVAASHKALLRGLMGADTGLKYHRGQCIYERGCYTFVGPTVASGMRKKLELGLNELTGRRWRTLVRRAAIQESKQSSVAELVS
jgi:hypothetical protein